MIQWTKSNYNYTGISGRFKVEAEYDGSYKGSKIYKVDILIKDDVSSKEDIWCRLRICHSVKEVKKRAKEFIDNYQPNIDAEKEIEYLINNYSSIFPTRQFAIKHLFLTNGNGFSWVDGCLFYGNRDLSEFEREYKKEREKEEPKINLNGLVNSLKKALEEASTEEDKRTFQNMIDDYSKHEIEFNRKWKQDQLDELYIQYSSPCDYCKIFTVPENIHPNWLKIAFEALDLMDKAEHDPKYGDYCFQWKTEAQKLRDLYTQKFSHLL